MHPETSQEAFLKSEIHMVGESSKEEKGLSRKEKELIFSE